MFNLLPESEKKQILSEYNTRRIIIALLFLFIAGCVAVISIFPTFLLSTSKVREVQSGVGSIRESAIFIEEESLRAKLAGAQGKIEYLKPSLTEVSVSELFRQAISYRGSAIRLKSLEFDQTGEAGGILSLAGIAESRNDLSVFVDALRSDSHFPEVDLPVSNFAKDRNAEFTLEIRGAF